ncbi:TetR/AcrR family transcriptional regulator [Acidovorax sp. GBBC 3334]|uniref:TetR/AcrR family transcriptional regulator n=1 Tax=unclassified Acidovorax TaxID=2684926 RepID=UPI002303D702|nr:MULTISPECIES: TetR/AcrR family transcriptional regulator [unclassified Acidovorax]MDA8453295.1 TetR/AcrR family transcriptional regulator [Acidovorax sp. GBBC 3334]MDA8520704.1 TetR/AcrR family transcriptional regulator [Acidovorax sp. NCPPB 4044]
MKPSRPSATPAGMRRQPTQERARQTIEAIFGATAQIVDNEGETALTTNRVAQVAGVSIGTLYQYFPSKEAVLLAMVERERNRVQQELQGMLDDGVARQRPVREVLAEVVRLLVSAFGTGGQSRVRRNLVRMGWRVDQHDRFTAALREGAERNAMALARLVEAGDGSIRPPTPAMMFVATRAVMGAIRSASLENSPLLGQPAFEDELVRMLWGVLRSGD